MTPWKTFFNTMTLLLLFGIGIASAFLYYQLINAPQPKEIGPQSGNQEKANQNNKQTLTPFAPVPLSVYQEITDRPLFVEGRLPPEMPEQTAKSIVDQQTPLKLRLEGVVITPKNRVAVIRDLNSNRLLRVSQGMNQDDWTLETVDNTSATVTRRGRKLRLELDIKRDQKSTKHKFKLPFRSSN